MVYEAVTTRELLFPSEQAEAYRSIWIEPSDGNVREAHSINVVSLALQKYKKFIGSVQIQFLISLA